MKISTLVCAAIFSASSYSYASIYTCDVVEFPNSVLGTIEMDTSQLYDHKSVEIKKDRFKVTCTILDPWNKTTLDCTFYEPETSEESPAVVITAGFAGEGAGLFALQTKYDGTDYLIQCKTPDHGATDKYLWNKKAKRLPSDSIGPE